MAAAGPRALELSCPELAAELKAAVEPLTGSSEYLLAPNHWRIVRIVPQPHEHHYTFRRKDYHLS